MLLVMNTNIIQKLIVEFEETPNPNTLKFYFCGYQISTNKTYEFDRNNNYINSGLVRDLFEIPEIESIFFGNDFISITKNINAEWENFRAKIIFIMIGHESEIIENRLFDDEFSNDDECQDFIEFDECDIGTVNQIKEILDEEIRPKIAMDGGDIKLVAYKDGIAYLKLSGACSSCPSSNITLYNYVREFLISMVENLIDIERI